jgi:hypothetical protein
MAPCVQVVGSRARRAANDVLLCFWRQMIELMALGGNREEF